MKQTRDEFIQSRKDGIVHDAVSTKALGCTDQKKTTAPTVERKWKGEPMSDLISRSEVWKAFISRVDSICDLEDVREILDSIPTAEPKVGRWIEQPPYKPFTDDDMEIFVAPKCSLCGKHGSHSNYCPNCGAKMEESR